MSWSLYVRFREVRFGGGLVNPEEIGDYAEQEDTEVDFSLVSAAAHEIGGWDVLKVHVNWDPAEADYVFVVVVRYHDGDTFGHTYGLGHIAGACPREEDAQALAASIRAGTYNGEDTPWEGYFASLQEINIVRLKVGSS